MEHQEPEEDIQHGSCTPRGTEHITSRNAEHSSFLKLPGELRNNIYELVLTGKVIHIISRHTNLQNGIHCPDISSRVINLNNHYSYRFGYQQLSHAICQFPNLEADLHDQTVQSANAGDSTVVATKRYNEMHDACRHRPDGPSLASAATGEPDCPAPVRLRTHLLLTSKQIWYEASKLLYIGNTFSFQRVPDMDLFLRVLRQEQRRLLHSINVHIDRGSSRGQFDIIASAVRDGCMPNLTNFSLVLGHETEVPELPSNPFGNCPPRHVRVFFMRDSFRLRHEAQRFERFLMSQEAHE